MNAVFISTANGDEANDDTQTCVKTPKQNYNKSSTYVTKEKTGSDCMVSTAAVVSFRSLFTTHLRPSLC